MPTQYDIIIIGGGPAGLTAATYARRAGKSVLVLEKAAFGGQITWSPKVENFPGELSITGTELGDRFLEQAMNQGAEVELEEVFASARIPVQSILPVRLFLQPEPNHECSVFPAKRISSATASVSVPCVMVLFTTAKLLLFTEAVTVLCRMLFYSPKPAAGSI